MFKLLSPLFLAVALFYSHAFADDRVMCYSSQNQTSVLQPDEYVTPPQDATSLDYRHWLAMKASGDVYTLPDLDEGLTGAAFIQRFEAFYSHPVPGYQYWSYSADRTTGLKYMVLEPLDPNQPWIFAFAGTQSTIDIFADLSLGRDQIEVIEKFIMGFLDCGKVDSFGRPLASHNWLVTGHSLGGGMAQIFAYLAQNLRIMLRMPEGRVELVTFNGFGARDVVLGGSSFADIVEPKLLSYNYFVTSDPVSKIGTHVGNTYELPMNGAGVNPAEIFKRHSLSTIESLVVSGEYVDFSSARAVTAPYSQPLNALKGVGEWLGFLAEDHRDKLNVQLEQRNLLFTAANVLFDRGLVGSLDGLIIDYLESLATDLKNDLRAQAQSNQRDELIVDLEQLLAILSQY